MADEYSFPAFTLKLGFIAVFFLGASLRPGLLHAQQPQPGSTEPPVALFGTTGVLLYDQTSNPGSTSWTSQDFESFFDSFDNQLADDFEVPGGGAWLIDGVNVVGTGLVGSSNTVDVWFFSDAGGLPGGTVCFYPDVMPTNRPSPSMDINLPSPCLLPPGIYWMSVQVNQPVTTVGSWFWTESTTQHLAPAAWQNPGDGYLTGCTTWGRRAADCNFGVSPDQMFQLEGIVAGPDLAVTKQLSNAHPDFGETIRFTVAVANHDPNTGATATGVVVSDLVPAELDIVDISVGQGTYDPNTGNWQVGALNSGDVATLTIDAVVNTLDPVINTASLTQSVPVDPNTENNSASVTVSPHAADLSINKAVFPLTPSLGDEVTFTIFVTHQDGSDVQSVRVRDRLPQGLGYVGHAAGQGTYDPNTGNWQVGALREGDVATLIVTTQVNTTAPVINTALIAFASVPDPFPGDNTDAASLNAVAADLEMRQKVTAVANKGGLVTATFEVQVTNEGPSETGGVEVADYLSPDMTVVSMAASQGTVAAMGSDLQWNVGTLAVDGSATLMLTVNAPADGDLKNAAEVTAADLSDIDSVPGDGQGDDFAAATAARRSVPDFVPEAGPGGVIDRGRRLVADLALTNEVDAAAPAVGAEVVYTIHVENLGPQATARVAATDHLPECLSFVAAAADQGDYDPDTGIWRIDHLYVTQDVVLEITAQVTDGCAGMVTNTAAITASSLPEPGPTFTLFDEPNPALENNRAEAVFTVATGARVAVETPVRLGLSYPNPFNPQTVVPFQLAETGHVTIKVYDLLGRAVATLVDGALEAGTHEVVFEAGHLATGVYLVRMVAAGVVRTQQVTLMK